MRTNQNTIQVEGSFTLSAAAAVTSNEGYDQTVTKTGTGVYRVRLPRAAVANYGVVGVPCAIANFGPGTAPATAVDCRVLAVATDTTAGAGFGDLIIDVQTTNATWVATDTTAACRVDFYVCVRVK